MPGIVDFLQGDKKPVTRALKSLAGSVRSVKDKDLHRKGGDIQMKEGLEKIL